MPRTNPALLEISGISHKFGGLQVLDGVDFEVAKGSLTGLIGPNGAGKSTLFNILSGFLLPQHGQVLFDKRDITRDSVRARSHAGLVRTFQTPKVFAGLTVRENLMTGYYRHLRSGTAGNILRSSRSRQDMAAMHARAIEAGERFSLQSVMDRPAGLVPAGMQRLVELARAWVSEPRLLMLDEPSSGLNSAEIAQMREALKQLNSEGMTILLVSHDMDLVDIAAEVHVLCFGSIIASGSMAQIKLDHGVRQAYLGV